MNTCENCKEEILTNFKECWNCGLEYPLYINEAAKDISTPSELKKDLGGTVEDLKKEDSIMFQRRDPFIWWDIPVFKKTKPIYIYILIIIVLFIDGYLNTDYYKSIVYDMHSYNFKYEYNFNRHLGAMIAIITINLLVSLIISGIINFFKSESFHWVLLLTTLIVVLFF